ncbi:hypothetical protein P353_18035 [Comamonas testosteroni]|uniref:Uncharacterized protein n=1 Tax=Comamonas testosteroni TaxID=285 RepID=A0A096HFC3_COMTE|nr:hypothetical protein P353_18035 [Comamonas testosteroni]
MEMQVLFRIVTGRIEKKGMLRTESESFWKDPLSSIGDWKAVFLSRLH